MTTHVVFVERAAGGSKSIERVYREIAERLPKHEFSYEFCTLQHAGGVGALIRNFVSFRRPPADVYHIPGDVHYMALALPAERTVLSIQDLHFLHRRTGLRRWLLRKLYLDLPLRRLKYVTASSVATCEEIQDVTGIPASRLRLIGHPVGLQYRSAGETSGFIPDKPTILQIGTAPNKNLARLFKALTGLSCHLRIIGRLTADIERELSNCGIEYSTAAELGAAEMVDEYRRADIVTFCSTYEGFGLPVLEAQAMGKPVVTSALPPMTGVAGAGAVFVDPYDESSIREGIESVIRDPDLRRRTLEAGIKNVKRFDPDRIAAQYARLYREIIGKAGQARGSAGG